MGLCPAAAATQPPGEEGRWVGPGKVLQQEGERREELRDARSSWLRALLAKVPQQPGVFIESLRYFWDSSRQLDQEAVLLASLKKELSHEKLEQLVLALSASQDPLALVSGQPKEDRPHVYVLTFEGDIGASRVASLQKEITAVLSVASERPVEVVLRVKSPGGAVTGYGLAAAELMRLRQGGVRLVACVDEVAASGGYLMACCADHIMCGPFAAVGSIGVIQGIPNVADRLEREGLKFVETTAGKWKRTVTPFRSPSSEDLAKAKADILLIYDQFASFVKSNRPQVDLDIVATGEVWFGANALAKGLVDELGTSAEYLSRAMRERGCEVLALNYSDTPRGLSSVLASSELSPGMFGAEPRFEADVAVGDLLA